jgi:hypothetical protein
MTHGHGASDRHLPSAPVTPAQRRAARRRLHALAFDVVARLKVLGTHGELEQLEIEDAAVRLAHASGHHIGSVREAVLLFESRDSPAVLCMRRYDHDRLGNWQAFELRAIDAE